MALRPLMEQAAELDEAGSKALAVEKYRAALRLWPEFEMAHYNLALCLQESGRLGEARRHFAQTLELLPPAASPEDTRRYDVVSRLGQLSAKLALGGATGGAAAAGAPLAPGQAKRLKRAAALLREALALQPADGASALALGQTLSARGRGAEALEQLRRSAELAPTNPMVAIELALGLHRHGGDAAEMEETLERALAMADPPKGVEPGVGAEFHSQLGLALRRELPLPARRHFERALALDPQHGSASTTCYHLGSMLREAGEGAAERRLYETAVGQGVWREVAQRPGYLAPAALPQGPWPAASDWPVLQRAIASLEESYPTIRAELLRSLQSTAWAADAAEAEGVQGVEGEQQGWGAQDLEGLTTSGEWHQSILLRNGLPTRTGFEETFPETTRVVTELLAGVGEGLPKGSVEFSLLSGGAHVRPHCGPSNHKWRLHLGMIVPAGASIRVGGLGTSQDAADGTDGPGLRRAWEEGRVMLFDDSYEHEVFHEGEGARVVLIVDVWQPQLVDEGQREQVRRDFGWHVGALAA